MAPCGDSLVMCIEILVFSSLGHEPISGIEGIYIRIALKLSEAPRQVKIKITQEIVTLVR